MVLLGRCEGCVDYANFEFKTSKKEIMDLKKDLSCIEEIVKAKTYLKKGPLSTLVMGLLQMIWIFLLY